MPACEKCWTDAYGYGGEDQVKRYHELLQERAGSPCSPQEQAGEYWDEKLQRDSRIRRPEEERGFEP